MLFRRSMSSSAMLSAGMEPLSRIWRADSRRCGAIGMKCGMTHGWLPSGERLPLTIVEVQDVQVVQAKRVPTSEGTGLNLQLGAGWQKRKRLSKADAGQFEARGLPLKRYMREFRVSEDALLPVGTSVTARHFVPGQYVDVQGTSKGKGFQGVMRRWGFKGQPASHGNSLAHRAGGSLGGSAGSMYATRVFPGKKMAGRMGGDRQTMHSLLVYRVDAKHNLLYIKGSVRCSTYRPRQCACRWRATAARSGRPETAPVLGLPPSAWPTLRPPDSQIPGPEGSVVRVKDAERKRRDTSSKGHFSMPPFPTFLPGDADGPEVLVWQGASKSQ